MAISQRRIDFQLVVLWAVVAACHVVQAVDIPYFVMKLIVVGLPEDIDDSFDLALNEATTAHLTNMLTAEVNVEANVEVESTFVKARIPQNLTQGVDLTVVNIAYQGTADVEIAQNIDLTPFLESAFGQTEGFPIFSNALEHEERLHGIGKLQVGLNDVIVGEGTLVARAGHGDEHDVPPDDDVDDDDADGLSRKSIILIVVSSALAWIMLVYGAYVVWCIHRDRKLEKRKDQRRQAHKIRRQVYADGRSSSHAYDFNSSTGSDYSPTKRSGRKKVPKSSKMLISKPSKQAKRQKKLLSIAEQDEESSCDEEQSNNESSFVSCESTESASGVLSKPSERINLAAGNSVRTKRTSRFQPHDSGVGIDRMDHLSVRSSSALRRPNEQFRSPPAVGSRTPNIRGGYDEKMPGMLMKQRVTGTFKPLSQESVQGSANTKAATAIEIKTLDTLPHNTESSFSSFGTNSSSTLVSTSNPKRWAGVHDSQTSTEKPLWSDLMSSVNSSNSMLSGARRRVHPQARNDSQSTMGSAVWGDLLNSTNSMIQSTTFQHHGNVSINSENQTLGSATNESTDIFMDDGLERTEMNQKPRFTDRPPATQNSRSRASTYDSAMSNDLEMSCGYADMGEEAMGNQSIHWDTSIDLANYGNQNTQLDVGYGSDCNSGSSSTGPGWRLT